MLRGAHSRDLAARETRDYASPVARRTYFVVLGVVILRLAAQVVLIPPFEGPDEPFHLDRAVSTVEYGLFQAQRPETLNPKIADAVRVTACAPDLGRVFGCPPFPGAPKEAARRVEAMPSPDEEVWNYESHQPPIYYLALAGAIELREGLRKQGDGALILETLLLGRTFSFLLVVLGLLVLMRSLPEVRRRPASMVLLGSTMCLPGAAESLVRVANDAGVFLWCSLAIAWLSAKCPSWRSGLLLAALGPLVKLTALPVVAVMAVRVWGLRRRAMALAIAAAATLVVPMQMLRGYEYGGTVELNRPGSFELLGPGDTALGIAKSIAVSLKTAFWLGNWSFFRPPRFLLVVFAASVVGLLSAYRLKRDSAWTVAHAAGLTAAAVGTVAFAVGSHRLFGIWGGVGGWYFWGWAPWLVAAVYELLNRRAESRIAHWSAAYAGTVLLTNALWFMEAYRLYGCIECVF